VYRDEPWLGHHENDFDGARNKAGFCFQSSTPVRVFLVESTLEKLLTLKQEIRGLFRIGNHSVHINDTQEETDRLAHVLFNGNSVHYLNYASVSSPKWFLKLFSYYRAWSDSNGLPRSRLCIDGSSVLAIYGLREARDLDFLHIGPIPTTGFKEISRHNHEAQHYRTPIDQLVSDPRLHFYCNGFKFLSLLAVRGMKAERGEQKDLADVAAIDALLNNSMQKRKGISLSDVVRAARPRIIVRELKFIALKLRFYFYVFRHKLSNR
jgi:hypothetical protein